MLIQSTHSANLVLSNIEVWAPSKVSANKDALVRKSSGKASTDAIVEQAYQTASKALSYLKREFGRSSYDGVGSTLRLRVHSIDPIYNTPNNAFWDQNERRLWLGDGDGKLFAPLGGSADVVTHELFHAVIDSEVKLSYTRQEGAIHESFADVLATGVDNNWQIAEDVYTPDVKGDALRDLSKLQYKKYQDLPQWEDDTRVLAEVPSHAAYLVGSKLGMNTMRRIWYTALTDHLVDHAGFSAARDATIAATRELYGNSSTELKTVTNAWDSVGILSAATKLQ